MTTNVNGRMARWRGVTNAEENRKSRCKYARRRGQRGRAQVVRLGRSGQVRCQEPGPVSQ